MGKTAESRISVGANEKNPLLTGGRIGILFGISVLLVLLTRLPFVPSYLYSFDNVNLALALQHFDPTKNQPQPPGYPFFVLEARIVHTLFGTPERTFAFLGSLISGLAVGVLYLLGKRLFSPAVGLTAAILLFANPVFWFSGLTSPLRPHLALFSALVAYLCWRASSEEPNFLYAATLALGLGSGFRPELLPLLFPLWLWTAWQCRSKSLRIIRSVVLLGASVLLWIAVVVIACGGLKQVIQTFSAYSLSQTQQTSMLWNPRSSSWLRWAGRAILWNGLGVVPWIWAVPFGWMRRRELSNLPRLVTFFAVWILPAAVFYLTVHIGDPDHALMTIPALCLIGGYCVIAAGRTVVDEWLPELKEGTALLIGIALVGNLLLFFGQFPLPQSNATGFRGLKSAEDAILIGTYETSYARVRWVNQMTDLGLLQIQSLKSTAGHRPLVVIWARDGEPVWRKVSYYLPSEHVWSLDETGDPASPAALAQLWSGAARLTRLSGTAPIRVPIPKGARIVWLVGSASVEGLRRAFPLQDSPPVYYSDLPSDSSVYRWGSFEFVPQ